MARILYGVCGVGAGHYTRSKILLEYLIKKHEVIIIGGLAAYSYLRKYFDNVHYVEGLEFEFKENKVLAVSTIIKNLRKITIKNYRLLKELKKIIENFKPDVAISDFEPYSNYYARKNKIKLISFDNEHYITEGEFEIPKKYLIDYYKYRIIVKRHKANSYIITTLPKQKLKNKSKAITINPIIRESLLRTKAKIGKNIVVYTSIIKNRKILNILRKFKKEKFAIFGSDTHKTEKNLLFRKFSDKEFDKELLNCKAVITFGGINLISEAIYLKKPLLVNPVKKHFEQILNALYVKNNGYGEFCEELTEKKLQEFLNNINKYKLKSYEPGNKELFKIIEKLIKGSE